MYQSHLMQSVDAADHMREVQARLQRQATTESRKVQGRVIASTKPAVLFAPFSAISGVARRTVVSPADR